MSVPSGLTASARLFFAKVYEVDEAAGDEIEVALGEDGELHVLVTKRPTGTIDAFEVRVDFT